MAILLSSHLLNQVQSVCDRIGIFAAGRLIGQGTLEQLASRFGDGKSRLELGFEVADEAEAERVASMIGDIDGVTGVARGRRASDPWLVTMRSSDDAARVRSGVLGLVAEHGLSLTSIRPVVPSLEDIYRRAVARPQGAVPAAVHARGAR
jgi:ABC-2 type transport system ATP-binding protein